MRGKQITRREILSAAPASLLLGTGLAEAGDWPVYRGDPVIGALLSLTGDWSSLGVASQALLRIAEESDMSSGRRPETMKRTSLTCRPDDALKQ